MSISNAVQRSPDRLATASVLTSLHPSESVRGRFGQAVNQTMAKPQRGFHSRFGFEKDVGRHCNDEDIGMLYSLNARFKTIRQICTMPLTGMLVALVMSSTTAWAPAHVTDSGVQFVITVR